MKDHHYHSSYRNTGSSTGRAIIITILLVGLIACTKEKVEEEVKRIDYKGLQSKQITNVKQILIGCAIFASDKGAGAYPTGT